MEQPSPLHMAAMNGDLIGVEAALRQEPGLINTRDADGLTPLDYAVDEKHREVAAFLLAHGADPNLSPEKGKGDSLLILAILDHDLPLATLLLDHGANCNQVDHFGYRAIQRSILSQDLPLTQLLIDRGAELHFDVGSRDDLTEAALVHGNGAIALALLRAGALYNPSKEKLSYCLVRAVGKGYLACVRKLVEMGADVHAFPNYLNTPLMEANSKGHLEVAMYLVDRGADPYFIPKACQGYDWVAAAGSEATRKWRQSLEDHAHLTAGMETGEDTPRQPRKRF